MSIRQLVRPDELGPSCRAATGRPHWCHDRPVRLPLALGLDADEPRLVFRGDIPAHPAALVELPPTLEPRIGAALRRAGIERLYAHQAAAFSAAAAGAHVGIVTGTASGKTLAYALPALDHLLRDRHARALYLSPTKALAQDQARALIALGLGSDVRVALYDGDTPPSERAADPA